MSNSRRASRPTTKKKNVIRPSLTQWRTSCDSAWPPRRNDRSADQTRSYEDASMFTQASATIVAARRKTALPVSVPRNSRNGVPTLRDQAVRSCSMERLLPGGEGAAALEALDAAARRGDARDPGIRGVAARAGLDRQLGRGGARPERRAAGGAGRPAGRELRVDRLLHGSSLLYLTT